MDKNKNKYAKKITDCIKKLKNKNYNEQIKIRKAQIQLIENEINTRKLEMEKFQQDFDFVIPDYILDEIIRQRGRKNNENLIALINLAVKNGSLSKENGKILKSTCQNKENNV